MYFPKSQIKSNLHTNGNEYILSTTKEEYKGYYYETSTGKKYTGKTPQDGFNILLLNIPPTIDKPLDNTKETSKKPLFPPPYPTNQYIIDVDNINPLAKNYNSSNIPNRYLPPYTPTLPTDKDKSLGAFSRYFCKKNNELIYLEISQQTYSALLAKSSTIAWDLYTAITTIWYIKGNKEKTYKANKGLISLIEQRQKWYGFSQYLKEDFLKYYLGE